MDLTQISSKGENGGRAGGGARGNRRRKDAYILMGGFAVYLLLAAFYPSLRFWERVPGLGAGRESVSVVEDYQRADRIFNPPGSVVKLPANDLTDFVFSPDGHYLILLFTDVEKRHSVIQIREVDRGESSQWKVWREYELDFHVVAVNAYRDRIAVIMQEAETAAKSLTNQPKPDEWGKYPPDEFRERTYILIYDYNGRETARELIAGKYLQGDFSGDLVFLQTSKVMFLMQLGADKIFRSKIDDATGIAGCRPAANSFICLTGNGTSLSSLALTGAAALTAVKVSTAQKILFWGEYGEYLVYYTADDRLTIKGAASEFVFPRKFNAVNLAAAKSVNGVDYLAVYSDSRLVLFALQGGSVGGVLYDEPVDYPLSQMVFYPGDDRFMLVANQTAADYLKGDLKVFTFNLQRAAPPQPSDTPLK